MERLQVVFSTLRQPDAQLVEHLNSLPRFERCIYIMSCAVEGLKTPLLPATMVDWLEARFPGSEARYSLRLSQYSAAKPIAPLLESLPIGLRGPVVRLLVLQGHLNKVRPAEAPAARKKVKKVAPQLQRAEVQTEKDASTGPAKNAAAPQPAAKRVAPNFDREQALKGLLG